MIYNSIEKAVPFFSFFQSKAWGQIHKISVPNFIHPLKSFRFVGAAISATTTTGSDYIIPDLNDFHFWLFEFLHGSFSFLY